MERLQIEPGAFAHKRTPARLHRPRLKYCLACVHLARAPRICSLLQAALACLPSGRARAHRLAAGVRRGLTHVKGSAVAPAIVPLLPAAARTMPHAIEFATEKRFVRRAREVKTMSTLVRLYCAGHRHVPQAQETLCAQCAALLDYATRRTVRCVFGDAKPTCANCLVHCYTPEMRARVRDLMRWAGPRMLLRHPILAIAHKLDGLRPSPKLPSKSSRPAKS